MVKLARLGLLTLAILVAGCGGSGGAGGEVDRAEIEKTLRIYLPQLARAYATNDTTPLNSYAAEREVATVQKRLSELYARGERLEPEFKNMTMETVKSWSYSNAYATTIEVWDLRLFATSGGGALVETLEQRNRVKYQLKKEDDRWVVLYRELQQTFDE